METVLLTKESYEDTCKYLNHPEWRVQGTNQWFEIKSIDFEKGILVAEHYEEEIGTFPIEGVELADCDAVHLKYRQLLEKVPTEIRDDLEDVVRELEGYASARGYNGCF